MKKILVTGGAGFIGSNFIKYILKNTSDIVINVDNLTYAGNIITLEDVSNFDTYIFEKVDICDYFSLKKVFNDNLPDCIVHLAAESHVDRSITNPDSFLKTNILGTYNILKISNEYYLKLDDSKKKNFRFLHVSTDEVFGDLKLNEENYFTEETPYNPSSPYSASKASSDHLVKAWNRTYNFPSIVTNCSNNYGPYQHPEKLIPVCILNAKNEIQIPIYDKGLQIRDWLFVEDHVKGLYRVLEDAKIGSYYNIGGNNELKNIDVVNIICEIMDQKIPIKKTNIKSYKNLITFVSDRPGHDFRYAIDASKIKNDLNWEPKYDFFSGLKETVNWYLQNNNWIEAVKNKKNDL